ncbi:fluoride efflux transporter CrcB [Methanolobus sp. WCC5]|uniref:fluoride efflux transporter CrcB n=1 Tax=Methanolobus sp. WCC5 TaxID=3125785 RepID=UPI0032467AE2
MNNNPFKEQGLGLLAIGTGGFLGAITRSVISGQSASATGTLTVNVLGSLLLGILMYSCEYLGYVSPRWRMFLGIGFLGSLTTFSTFTIQTFQMSFPEGLLNIVANVLLTLAGIFTGRAFIIYLVRRREKINGP